jgi:phosphotransferase system enzyme I (PtsI)
MGGVGTTLENLKAAVAGETYEYTEMYPPMVEQAKAELREKGVPFSEEIPVGTMIEVPSAALVSDHLARMVDFFSIGTNDLTQYTVAADRLLGTVANLQDPWNPAVLRLIREVGRAGELTNKSVGVCGEAAADPALAVVLIGLGVTSLSMSPIALADVRAEISRFTLVEARELAERALSARNAADARTIASGVFHQ